MNYIMPYSPGIRQYLIFHFYHCALTGVKHVLSIWSEIETAIYDCKWPQNSNGARTLNYYCHRTCCLNVANRCSCAASIFLCAVSWDTRTVSGWMVAHNRTMAATRQSKVWLEADVESRWCWTVLAAPILLWVGATSCCSCCQSISALDDFIKQIIFDIILKL